MLQFIVRKLGGFIVCVAIRFGQNKGSSCRHSDCVVVFGQSTIVVVVQCFVTCFIQVGWRHWLPTCVTNRGRGRTWLQVMVEWCHGLPEGWKHSASAQAWEQSCSFQRSKDHTDCHFILKITAVCHELCCCWCWWMVKLFFLLASLGTARAVEKKVIDFPRCFWHQVIVWSSYN